MAEIETAAPPKEGTLEHAQWLRQEKLEEIIKAAGIDVSKYEPAIAKCMIADYYCLAFVSRENIRLEGGTFHSMAYLYRNGRRDTDRLMVETAYHHKGIWKWCPN